MLRGTDIAASASDAESADTESGACLEVMTAVNSLFAMAYPTRAPARPYALENVRRIIAP